MDFAMLDYGHQLSILLTCVKAMGSDIDSRNNKETNRRTRTICSAVSNNYFIISHFRLMSFYSKNLSKIKIFPIPNKLSIFSCFFHAFNLLIFLFHSEL